MEEKTMDVTPAEDTAIDSSTEEQTSDTDSETEVSDQDTEVEETEERIPRSRFNQAIEKERARVREMEEKLRSLEEKIGKSPEDVAKQQQSDTIKDQLKQLGFLTKEEVEAERRRAQEDDFIKSELGRLEKEWDGKEGKPKFDRQPVIQFALDNKIGDPEAAFLKMNNKAIIDWQIRSAVNKSKGVKTEVSDGSGSSQVGTSNKDLTSAAKSGDRQALMTLLKRQIKR